MINSILFLVAVVATIVHLSSRKKVRSNGGAIEVLLSYLIPLNIGVMALIIWIADAFYASETAKMMGWLTNSPFQYEVAVANLGFAIVGILSIWQRKGFWLATVLANSTYVLGCAWGHYRLFYAHTTAMHQGFFLFIDSILLPIVLLALTLMYAKQNKYFKDY